jgi:hypothetical protein
LLQPYHRAGNRNFAVQVNPTAQPPELAGWLHARGLVRDDNWARLYRGVENPPTVETDLRVERVGPDYGEALAEIVCEAFEVMPALRPWVAACVGRPGWRHYLAFDGATPVATGALYVQDGLGWLGWATTLPSHRGRGAQSAIVARRIRDAAALGCRWLVVETAEDTPQEPSISYHNQVRAGFRLAHLRPNYRLRDE